MGRPPVTLMGATALALILATASAGAGFNEETQFGSGLTIPVAWGDADGDGDLDLAVGNFNQQNQLFINNGDGTFSEQPEFGVGATFAVVWGDYDNDGDLDLAVGNGSNQQNRLYVNLGGGTFAGEDQFGVSRTNALAWGDYDNDGDLDLAAGNGLLGFPQQNYLYTNNGAGSFDQSPAFGTGQSASVAWGDADGDGDLDLAVANGGFGAVGQNYLYVNEGGGSFTELARFGEEDTACLAWCDADGDGDLDLAVGNWNNGENRLYVNDGGNDFSVAASLGGRDTNTLSWGDFNHDGRFDVAVGNGDFGSADTNFVYTNNGDGTFDEAAEFGLGSTDALAWGDPDGDGDLDVASGNEHTPTQNYFYRNDRNSDDYLVLKLIGRYAPLGSGYSNRDGIGAKIAVYEAGFVGDPSHLLGYREVAAHGGFAPQNQIDPHFGLAGQNTVDVRISWPGSDGSAIAQDLEGLPIPGRLTVIEGEPLSDAPGGPAGEPPGGLGLHVFPNPMTREATLRLDGVPPRAVSRLRIHDAAGRVVATLAPRHASGGAIAVWDGRTSTGQAAPAGVYWVVDALGGASGRVLLVH